MDNNNIIDDIVANTELSTPEKLFMFVTICDEKVLVRHMQKTAMMAKIGMVTPSPVDSFAYGVLKIARPELFESSDEDKQ